MNKLSFKNIINNLNEEIEKVESDAENNLMSSEKAIGLCSLALMQLKANALEEGFKNEQEEINFFKNIKPLVFSKLIFYHTLFQIELKRPKAILLQEEYLKQTLKKLNVFFQENQQMCQYYWGDHDYNDELFFLRRHVSGYISHHVIFPFVDHEFSTLHDYTFSSIKAHEQLIRKFETEIIQMSGGSVISMYAGGKYTWTDSKISLVELIYALHSIDSINNGKIEIKELVKIFETIFNIRLEEYSRTFLDIRMRKKERTTYLDMLKKSLINRMEEADG